MSLTSFVEHPKVREAFNKNCPLKKEFKPQIRPSLNAAPISKNYSQVGVAFDYLFRFYLEKLNSDCVMDFGWSALGAFRSIEETSNNYKIAKEIVADVEFQKKRYTDSELFTDDLLNSTLRLATLEPIYRANRGFEYIGRADPDDVNDLKQLISLINPKDWLGKNRC
jgi:midasin (ATPase involved in ribosome maturation)